MIKLFAAKTDIWEDELYFKKMLEQVKPERKAKIDRYVKQSDKRRSLAAELLCKKAFMEFLNHSGDMDMQQEYEIAYGREGKPYCVNFPKFYFNLSHSGDYAVCALSEREVGVDIQRQKKYQPKLAERFFSREEVKRLEEAGEEEKEKLFCEIWTLKESYMKYTGKGMKQEMKSYYEDMATGQIIENGVKKSVYTHHYHEIEGYAIAVCGEEKEFCEIIF